MKHGSNNMQVRFIPQNPFTSCSRAYKNALLFKAIAYAELVDCSILDNLGPVHL